MKTPERQAITQVASQHLSEKGQVEVAEYLENDGVRSAKLYLLGAIDARWVDKKISDKEAAEAYRALNVDPDTASKVRQRSKNHP